MILLFFFTHFSKSGVTGRYTSILLHYDILTRMTTFDDDVYDDYDCQRFFFFFNLYLLLKALARAPFLSYLFFFHFTFYDMSYNDGGFDDL